MINPDRSNVCRSSFPGEGLECLSAKAACLSALQPISPGRGGHFCPVHGWAISNPRCPCPGAPGFDSSRFFFPVRTTYRDVSSMMCGAFFGAIGRYSAEILKGRIFHSPSEFGAPRCGSPEPGRKSRSRSLLLIHLRPGANVMTPPANVQFENQLGAIAQRTPAEPESTPALSPAGSCQGPQGDGR